MQLNRVCCFSFIVGLLYFQIIRLQGYLELGTAVVVQRGVGKTSPRTSI